MTMKKTRISILVVVCTAFILNVTSVCAQEIKHPDIFIKATSADVSTLDPATAYDTSSSQKIENVYETLVRFDGEYTDQFAPVLATEVPTIENGGISSDGKTYTFTIREGVTFHEGGKLIPEDVEYSIERSMIVDQVGGPSWMLLEALTGEGSTRSAEGLKPGIIETIMDAVEVEGDRIVLHLPKPYPPLMGILSKSWAAVLNKKWAIEQGCWDGTLENAAKHNNPDKGREPLAKVMNGTGPYTMQNWEPRSRFVFERFDGYWGNIPALQRAVIKYVPEWGPRKAMLLNGDVDYAEVEDQFVEELSNASGITQYAVPQLAMTAMMFCQNIEPTGNPNIGSGQLDGEGIPPNFFSDIDVRKAFMHAFDREFYAEAVLKHLSIVPTSPNIDGLPYHVDIPVYEFDLDKAEEYFKKAWHGEVWAKGFKLTITYNTGRLKRKEAALMLKKNIEALNPKFHIEINEMQWSQYLADYTNLKYPVYFAGWSADYADPHNFIYTFMHSNGAHGQFIGYSNPEVDALCEEGIATTETKKRAEIYEKLQRLWRSEAIGLCVYQPTLVRHYKDWIKGVITNPLDDDAAEWLFQLRKE